MERTGAQEVLVAALRDLYDWQGVFVWSETPHPELGGAKPIDVMQTDAGTVTVMRIVDRMRDGAYL